MTLTREEILEREPGPELDALIAERVMGWTTSDSWDGRYWVDADKCSRYEKKDFKPSQYINIVWEVVMHLKSKYWYFMLSDENEGWEASFYWDPHRPAFEAVSAGAPEAICKAALMAALKL